MRILGIDQSLTGTGIAIVEDGRFDTLEVVKTRAKGLARVHHIVERCLELAAECDVVAVEQPAFSMRRSASTGALFGLYGVMTYQLWLIGKEPVVVNNMHRSTYATGKANAKKEQVMLAAARRYRDERLDDNNIVDAAVIAAMVARLLGEPVADEGVMPQANLDALVRLSLPPSIDHLISDDLATERAWLAVAARVTKAQLGALKALEGASPEYANALVDYATERGYTIYRTQQWVTCTRRLDQPSHTCGAIKCTTEWATPPTWERPVLLRQVDGEGWAILSQEPADHGVDAPAGEGRRARLHARTIEPAASLAA